MRKKQQVLYLPIIFIYLFFANNAFAITRNTVISTANSYANYEWNCSASNANSTYNYFTANTSVTGVAYNWGGFDLISQFQTKINSGEVAGDSKHFNIPADHPEYAGVDCSGFVSRCWGLTTKLSTSDLANISTEISWNNLKQGDILLNPGVHVRLFDTFNDQGMALVFESNIPPVANPAKVVKGKTYWNENNYKPRKYDDIDESNPTLKFNIGDTIEVFGTGGIGLKAWTNTCSGSYINKSDGFVGVVIDDSSVLCDGYIRWKIRWNNDLSERWSAEGWMRKVTDTTPAIATITNPTSCDSSSNSTVSSITISGSASDSGGSGLDYVIVVNSTNQTGFYDYSPSGNSAPFSIPGITLNQGQNEIFARAYDIAGNTPGFCIINVTYTPQPVETVSKPNAPSGTANGTTNTNYTYTASGTSSNLGHPLEYMFSWGDSTYSNWSSSTSASKSWANPGIYTVRTKARCSTDTAIVSDWSSELSINITTSCTYSIPHPNISISASGGSSSINVTTQSECDWTAISNDPWITVKSGNNGSGNGIVNYSVTSDSSTDPRIGTIAVAGNIFTINQSGISPTDTENPTVTITNPAVNPFPTNNSTINISGNALDNIGVTRVTWVSEGDNGTCNETTNWSVNDIVLNEGTNVITVFAWDAMNNTSTDHLVVVYTPLSNPALPDLTPSKLNNWNNNIPIGIVQLASDEVHNYNGPYYDGQIVYYNWLCLNDGDTTALNYLVRLSVIGPYSCNSVSGFQSTLKDERECLSNDHAVGPLPAGEYTFKLWVDFSGEVDESDENNNYYERSISVLPPPDTEPPSPNTIAFFDTGTAQISITSNTAYDSTPPVYYKIAGQFYDTALGWTDTEGGVSSYEFSTSCPTIWVDDDLTENSLYRYRQIVKDSVNPPNYDTSDWYEVSTLPSQLENHPPILDVIGNKIIQEGDLLEFTVNASDPNGDEIIYTASNLPTGAEFDTASRKFSWIPSHGQAGNYQNVTFTASDGRIPPMTDYEFITITVGAINQPPILTPIGNKTINEGGLLEFLVNASDPDEGDTLSYTASNLPIGAEFNTIPQTFSWTPDYGRAGNYQNILFTVTDDGVPLASDSESITISVGNVNRPPSLNPIGNRTVSEGELLQFTIIAQDPDGDKLIYTAGNLPPNAVFYSTVQTFSWIPGYSQSGNYESVSFTVADNGIPQENDSESITVSVGNTNRLPMLNPVGNKSVKRMEELVFIVIGSDPDGDYLTYSALNLPEGSVFTDQKFSWAVGFNQTGIYPNVRFEITDGVDTDFEEITITATKGKPRPKGIKGTAGNAQVELSWEFENDYESQGYNLYRREENNSLSKINTELIQDTSYLDISAYNNRKYYYCVTAVDYESEESDYSYEIDLIPQYPLSGEVADCDINKENGLNIIDGRDLHTLCNAFGSEPNNPKWSSSADINKDGFVDGEDLFLLSKNFGGMY